MLNVKKQNAPEAVNKDLRELLRSRVEDFE